MAARWIVLSLLLTVCVGVIVKLCAYDDTYFGSDDISYLKMSPLLDVENRQQRLGDEASDTSVDVTAFTGMPSVYVAAVTEYVASILAAIEATPLVRNHYFRDNKESQGHFPYLTFPVIDRAMLIPITLLPRPEAARTWDRSAAGQAAGWDSDEGAVQDRGSVYGRTLLFTPGIRSKNPATTPSIPYGGTVGPRFYSDNPYFLRLGKLVASPQYYKFGRRIDVTRSLRCGELGGAVLLAEIVTVPAFRENPRLRWVSIKEGEHLRRFLAYSLVDGNGAIRTVADRTVISEFVRPLICHWYQPKVGKHDALLLPTPLGWPVTFEESLDLKMNVIPHEDWCLDDWFPAQEDACWVIREAEDSEPLKESFLLMPASEESDRPVFFIALFAETEPKQLVKELAALYKVSPDTALNSPETMQRLNSLYEKVRDFPLDK